MLADGIDRAELAVTLWYVCLPDAYQRLVVEAGWSTARFRTWLIERLRREPAG